MPAERQGNMLIVDCKVTVGFTNPTYVASRQEVEIVPHEEFERLMKENQPTRHYRYGMNAGGPEDGLVEWISPGTNHRYLVDMTGPGIYRKFVDESTLSAEFLDA